MFAVIHIPYFALQAVLRTEPETGFRPAALVDPALSKSNLVQLNDPARQQGVREGMTASQALARCPELAIKTRSPAQQTAAAGIVLQTACTVTPYVEATAPGICTMELKGAEFILFGRGELLRAPNFSVGRCPETEGTMNIRDSQDKVAAPSRRCPAPDSPKTWDSQDLALPGSIANKLVRDLAGFYLDARIGIAATPSLALVAARVANPVMVALKAGEFVETLPIEALEPPAEIREILRRWGVRTAGAFLALGKDKVAERLGSEALELFECVEARSIRPLKIVAPPENFAEQMDFEQEVETAAPLLFVLQRFVEQLARRLDALHLAVAELHLRLGLSSGAHYEHVFKIPSPSADVGTLFRTLQTHLETVRSESTIISVALAARPLPPETHQFGLFEVTLRNPNQFAETLSRLGALCGPDRVGTPVPEGTYKPDAFQIKSPDFNGDSPHRQAALSSRGQAKEEIRLVRRSLGEGGNPQSARGPALRRYRPPVTAQIEFRQDRPAVVRSEVCRGAVLDCRGPFVTSGNWWDAPGWSLEQWDVQTSDGALHRVCRRGDGCFVEGTYD